ncbi:MAG: YrdB family protein [Caldilineaceae bacterium]
MLAFNMALRFVLELCALGALGYWGFTAGPETIGKFVLGLGAPILAAVLWGMFVAPKAVRPLHDPAKLLVELVVFGGAAAALYAAGQPLWAGVLLVVYGINRWLLVRLGAM